MGQLSERLAALSPHQQDAVRVIRVACFTETEGELQRGVKACTRAFGLIYVFKTGPSPPAGRLEC